jgi:glycosyltransferase involved in cell wall biosynthesis
MKFKNLTYKLPFIYRKNIKGQHSEGPSIRKDLISVVIASYQRKNLLQKTIQSVRTNNIKLPFEIIVVDGGSDDGTLEWLIRQKDIITIVQHNRGEFKGKPIKRRSWGYFMNLGFKAAQGWYILMLSDDCLLLADAVNNAIGYHLRLAESIKNIGGLAFYYRNWPEEEKYYVQKTLGSKLMVNHGIFLKHALEKVNYADEDRYIFYKADGDLCLKMWQAGYEIVDCPTSFVEHYYDPQEPVRRANNVVLKQDKNAYKKRWEGIYHSKNKHGIKGKIYSEKKDENLTAEKNWGDILERNR